MRRRRPVTLSVVRSVVRAVVRSIVTCALGLAAVGGLRADARVNKRDAALLKQKVAAITAHAEKPTRTTRRTIVTDTEVNSYLVYEAGDQIPFGVVDPSISAIGTGRVSGRAVVDLDAVRRQKAPTSLLDPMNYLMGRLSVTAVGTLKTSNGVGHFDLESASVGSIPVPKILLQEIVSYYSRTPQKPGGIGLDDPFDLPARIREIQVQRGQAIIIQ
jgi:hypothetical protein